MHDGMPKCRLERFSGRLKAELFRRAYGTDLAAPM